jgi:hypothetical protein
VGNQAVNLCPGIAPRGAVLVLITKQRCTFSDLKPFCRAQGPKGLYQLVQSVLR